MRLNTLIDLTCELSRIIYHKFCVILSALDFNIHRVQCIANLCLKNINSYWMFKHTSCVICFLKLLKKSKIVVI